jgi:3-oxoacyl-[acyl-carrier protein] reductase
MDTGLEGRVAIVTGVSRRSGIGAAIARRLAERGARLLIHSWVAHDAEQPWRADEGGVPRILDELRASTSTEHIDADLVDPLAPGRIVDAARAAFGHVDILVSNHARSSRQDLEHLTADELDASFAINSRATLLLIRDFAAQHERPDGGRIVMMISGQHLGPMPDELPYIASKGVLHQLTQSLAAHLAPRGITVNTVNPGATDTGWANDDVIREVLAASPQGRWGQPDDAARLIAWLASDDARWVTGQIINSTGAGP